MKKSLRSLSEAIRFWIDENHFNLKGAAGALRISLAELHNILQGKTPKRETLFRIAKRIDISNPHAFILSEANRIETPDRIKELLWFFKESPRGYVMSAVSIPAGCGAFEFGTATTYGFEMGMVVKGEGMFFSKGIRKDEAYTVQPFNRDNR